MANAILKKCDDWEIWFCN